VRERTCASERANLRHATTNDHVDAVERTHLLGDPGEPACARGSVGVRFRSGEAAERLREEDASARDATDRGGSANETTEEARRRRREGRCHERTVRDPSRRRSVERVKNTRPGSRHAKGSPSRRAT
jgi:hypothetical protein